MGKGQQAIEPPLSPGQLAFYRSNGYLVVHDLFTSTECAEVLDRADELYSPGAIEGCFETVSLDEAGDDILKAYPRMIHPHRVDNVFMRYLKHPGVTAILEVLLEREAMGIQSMFYWKPAGAKGQAFHQDSFFVKGEPDTGIAAWTALENTDETNGGLIIVEGTQSMELLEMLPIEPDRYFSIEAVTPPATSVQKAVPLRSGDTLFFGGRLIHGSEPNLSPDRFRRSLICHYVGTDTSTMSDYYKPAVELK